MNKKDIDREAEREAKALKKQGRTHKSKRLRLKTDYMSAQELRVFGNIL